MGTGTERRVWVAGALGLLALALTGCLEATTTRCGDRVCPAGTIGCTSFCAPDIAVDLQDVWGTDPSNVYAVGEEGTLLRWDGSSWSPMDPQTHLRILGVWGTARGTMFAMG